MWATNILVDRFEFVGQSKVSDDAKAAESQTSAGARVNHAPDESLLKQDTSTPF